MLIRIARFGAALSLLSVLASPVHAHSFTLGPLEIGHPWARETPAGAQVGAGYLAIRNSGSEPDRLIAAATPAADKTEIHTTENQGGVAKMRQLNAVEIPPAGETQLKPGGHHLMLIGLKQPLTKGARIPATLTFEKAGTFEVELAVEAIGYGGAVDAHDHHAPAAHKH